MNKKSLIILSVIFLFVLEVFRYNSDAYKLLEDLKTYLFEHEQTNSEECPEGELLSSVDKEAILSLNDLVRIYNNSDLGFKVLVPTGMELSSKDEKSVLFSLQTDSSFVAMNIDTIGVEKGTSLEERYNKYLASWEERFIIVTTHESINDDHILLSGGAISKQDPGIKFQFIRKLVNKGQDYDLSLFILFDEDLYGQLEEEVSVSVILFPECPDV